MRTAIVPMILGIDFPNPFEMLSKAFQSAYQWQANVIEKMVTGTSVSVVHTPLKVLYESNVNLALYFAYAVFGLSLIIGVFLAKHRRIGEAFVVWAIVVALSPVWVQFVDALTGSSISISKTLTSFSVESVNAKVPMPDNPVVGFFIFIGAFFMGFTLAAFVVSFDMLAVVMAAWMLPFFALRAIGPRTKKICNLIWAIGIVGVFLGRPTVTFFVEAGVWMMKTLPMGQTSFGGGIYIMTGYAMALLFQFVLIVGCYHAVNAIDGKVAAFAAGTVAAFIRKTVKVDIAKLRKDRPRPLPVVIHNQKKPGMADHAKKAATDEVRKQTAAAIKKGALVAAKKAATAAAAAAV